MNYSLASIEDMRDHLNVREGTTTYDTRIKSVLLAATKMIENGVGRDFSRKSHMQLVNSKTTAGEYLDLYGEASGGSISRTSDQTIILAGINVDPDTFEARYSPTREFTDATIIPAKAITLDGNKVHISHPMYHGNRTIKLSYTAGFQTTEGSDEAFPVLDVTHDLSYACCLQALTLWHRNAPNSAGLSSDEKSKKGASFKVRGGLDPDVIALVAPYRRVLSGAG